MASSARTGLADRDGPHGSLSFEPLTPTAFLDRAAAVHADRLAVVDGALRLTYHQFHDRCLRLAGALADLGIRPGDRVAVLAPNTHLLLEAHFGVLYGGAVLVTLNTRLSADELRYIVEHAGCRALLYDPDLAELAAAIVRTLPGVRLVDGGTEYERLLAAAAPRRVPVPDERALMALNYTSGTTGHPKGVMYHHRGAYLQSLAMVTHFGLGTGTVYLWTLPMFHCNGWCFTWAVTAAGGTHVCLRRVVPDRVWDLIQSEGVTMLCAAPTVLVSLAEAGSASSVPDRRVTVAVGGAPPSPSLLRRCAALGFDITHLYGLTETFGPVAICDWQPEWDHRPAPEQATLRARQGVANVISCALRVVDTDGHDVPADGETVGEVAMRGNNVMLGYHRDEAATRAAAPDGWFRTGDLGVRHPDGYLELRDRAKDVIISGGENISSIEVEAVLSGHPAVLEAAVVAVPDERWGERPVAFVTLRPGAHAAPDTLRAHVRAHLAAFKVPDRIEFRDLPKTASGKVRKVELRAAARQD
ncbi:MULTISPECIES: long-chain-fatty-acid--CoA ligase [unclassified Micromonospora]|uniref:long-chain-fatty-acid--CoA ligase n=1 Tax=unclassified Micromonospora TaxID=2617518 RepID=UPI003644660E